jgi:alpha-1,2-mannosyltransferase
MYFNMLAFSFAVQPAKSRRPNPTDSRTLFAIVLFGAGAIIGWPFSILVSFPFVFEELFVYSGDRVADTVVGKWLTERWIRMLGSVVLASFIFVRKVFRMSSQYADYYTLSLLQIPMIAIDSIAYGKLAVTLWNIISYNIFGGAERGPDLYGTEPWHFYILNLVLNFNILTLLALLSLPILMATSYFDYNRIASTKPSVQESSPYFLIGIRLAPFYLWTLTLSLQAHKEERFMFPVYPLLCFNASVTLYLLRGWLEKLYAKITSPYQVCCPIDGNDTRTNSLQASKSYAVRSMATNVLVASAVISFLRIAALFQYYHAPMAIAIHFENIELPRLLNATNLLPPTPPNSKSGRNENVDLSPIKQFGLRLCIGKEWYRFPGHFLVPDGVEVRFIKSEFDGLLPQPFPPSTGISPLWPWDGMRVIPEGLNDLNKENTAYYVSHTSRLCLNPLLTHFSGRRC